MDDFKEQAQALLAWSYIASPCRQSVLRQFNFATVGLIEETGLPVRRSAGTGVPPAVHGCSRHLCHDYPADPYRPIALSPYPNRAGARQNGGRVFQPAEMVAVVFIAKAIPFCYLLQAWSPCLGMHHSPHESGRASSPANRCDADCVGLAHSGLQRAQPCCRARHRSAGGAPEIGALRLPPACRSRARWRSVSPKKA
jgi:hypothetical protein